MNSISFLGPMILSACVSSIVNDGNGLFCNFNQPKLQVTKYSYDTEKSCYKDGIFYSRCKDLENPEVLYYHNLLKSQNDQLRQTY